jgi:hypothetical protein
MNVYDDLFLGPAPVPAFGSALDPTINQGAGPMGRIAFLNIVPLILQAAQLVAAQNTTAATPLTLFAGTGVTLGSAPDGTGRSVYILDCNRCVSIASSANFSGGTFTITGFDIFGRLQTNTITGPNNGTVISTKAFKSILSIVPSASVASNITAGYADKFGLPWAIYNKGYTSIKWKDVRTEDTGTLTVGDATTPATATTTDPRGTYVPSDAADGSKRLVVWMHLTAAQCGPYATLVDAVGVTPA